MKISIIIPTLRDNAVYLKACVDSIKKYSKEEHEIIIATNNGEPWDVGMDGVKVVHNSAQGQCGATNKAVKEATNEYVLISDDDVIFPPNWEELTEKAKEVEFLSGTFMEGKCKGATNCDPFSIHDFGSNPGDFRWEEWERDYNCLAEQKWQSGFGFPLVFKKSLWEEIGGYDENFDPWGSSCDSDVEYKVMLRGIMPMRWRGVHTYHFGLVSGTFTKPEALPYWDKNRRYFEDKWGLVRCRIPEIWYADFKIDGNRLKFRPEWAKLYGNSNITWK